MTVASATVLQRLRAAGLRPTMARIGVLQVIEASGPVRLSAEDVFRKMMLRGTRVSVGTVYRSIHQLEDGGLVLREWDHSRKAYFRGKPANFDAHTLRLLCRTCGRGIALTDAALHERLEHLALLQGIRIAAHAVTITVDCAGCADRHCDSRLRLAPARARTAVALSQPAAP